MFFHLFKYKLKILLKPSEDLFWILVFPIILGTLFFVSFSNLMDKYETFQTIPVAVVEEGTSNDHFSSFLEELNASTNQKILGITKTTADEATRLLKDQKVDAIITVNSDVSLTVLEDGLNQSILKSILDQYKQMSASIEAAAILSPTNIEKIVQILTSTYNFNIETKLNQRDNLDNTTWYYFALISMTCLYGCTLGLKCALSIQANLTSLAARRTVSPTHKLKIITTDFLASVLVQFAAIVILICYLLFGLKINFGDRIGFVLLTSLIGCIIGVSNGLFVGSIGRMTENIKSAILMGVTMLLCFFGGLMDNTMKDKVENVFPLFNRLNPSALISDSLYSLSIYDNYHRYFMNMTILLIISIALCLGSYFVVRRVKYASI